MIDRDYDFFDEGLADIDWGSGSEMSPASSHLESGVFHMGNVNFYGNVFFNSNVMFNMQQ